MLRLILVLIIAFGTVACGNKGALYLPEDNPLKSAENTAN